MEKYYNQSINKIFYPGRTKMTNFTRPRRFHPTSVNLHPAHIQIMTQLIKKGYATNRSEIVRAALLTYFANHQIQLLDDKK